MKNKKLKIDFMIYDITKDEWTWISEIKSGEFIHNNTLIKVFTTDRGYTFYQTKWPRIQISNISWDKCKETIKDRQDNAEHYAYMDHLGDETMLEMYNNNHNNWTGD